MQSSKQKAMQKREIKFNKDIRQNYDVRHPEQIPKKAKDEFKRVPKY